MENCVQGHTKLHIVLIWVEEMAYILLRMFSSLFSDFSDMVMYVQNESGLSARMQNRDKLNGWTYLYFLK